MKQIYTTVRSFINDALDKFDLNMWELHIQQKDAVYSKGRKVVLSIENKVLSHMGASGAFNYISVTTFEDNGSIAVSSSVLENASVRLPSESGNDAVTELKALFEEFLEASVFHTYAKDGPFGKSSSGEDRNHVMSTYYQGSKEEKEHNYDELLNLLENVEPVFPKENKYRVVSVHPQMMAEKQYFLPFLRVLKEELEGRRGNVKKLLRDNGEVLTFDHINAVLNVFTQFSDEGNYYFVKLTETFGAFVTLLVLREYLERVAEFSVQEAEKFFIDLSEFYDRVETKKAEDLTEDGASAIIRFFTNSSFL